MLITAHRGFSGRQPEMTRAAYVEAVAWCERTGIPLGLETDVHFSADDELICLHDLQVDRTANRTGPAYGFTLAQLRAMDFSGGHLPRPDADQRALITLAELLDLVAQARQRGVEVGVVIETKHPNPRGLEVEERVAAMLTAYGWHTAGSPVRLLSFSVAAVQRLGELLPELPATFLLEKTFGTYADGRLPAGIDTVGPDWLLLAEDPGYVARVRLHGGEVHTWTVNDPEAVRFCAGIGVSGITTDQPDVVAQALGLGRRIP